MKKHSLILGGLVLLVSACAPQAPPVDLDAERTALRDTDQMRFEILRSGLLSTPGFALSWTVTKADVSQAGDLGYTTGTYDHTVHDAAGNPVMTRGKYVTVWKKQEDGQWEVVAEIKQDAPPSVPEG